MKLSEIDIKKIEKALKLHSDYSGDYSKGHKFREITDHISSFYFKGPPSIRWSKLLNLYYDQVGVKNLKESLDRLKKIDDENKAKE